MKSLPRRLSAILQSSCPLVATTLIMVIPLRFAGSSLRRYPCLSQAADAGRVDHLLQLVAALVNDFARTIQNIDVQVRQLRSRVIEIQIAPCRGLCRHGDRYAHFGGATLDFPTKPRCQEGHLVRGWSRTSSPRGGEQCRTRSSSILSGTRNREKSLISRRESEIRSRYSTYEQPRCR